MAENQTTERQTVERRITDEAFDLGLETPSQREAALLDAAETLRRAKEALRVAEARYAWELARWPTLGVQTDAE